MTTFRARSADVLGETHRERINTLVTDMIFHSRWHRESWAWTPEVEQAMEALRAVHV